eukprot:765259-Hanusia_phi.AAC.1
MRRRKPLRGAGDARRPAEGQQRGRAAQSGKKVRAVVRPHRSRMLSPISLERTGMSSSSSSLHKEPSDAHVPLLSSADEQDADDIVLDIQTDSKRHSHSRHSRSDLSSRHDSMRSTDSA